MSYIIVAEVDLLSEPNIHADKNKVNARILSEKDNILEFDVRGEWGKQREITLNLCKSLINAGFIEFEIHHSY